jgi:hypothetical protein
MNMVIHSLVGYDPQTDGRKFDLPIPPDRFSLVKRIVRFEEDDPEAYDSYKLTYSQAKDIAGIMPHFQTLPHDLHFYLECRVSADHE